MLAAGSGGKVNRFRVYLEWDLFDTPENRVITSGLTLASLCKACLAKPQTCSRPAKGLANNFGYRFATYSRQYRSGN